MVNNALSRLDLTDIDTFEHGYLPIAAAYCRSIDLIGTVNRLVPSQMTLSPGQIVQAMVLDTLSGRSPLYRLEDFMDGQDTEILLGEKIDARLFSDTNIGRSFDQIFKAGSSKVLTELGVNASDVFKLDMRSVSYDTTSTTVWGDYDNAGPDSEGPNITYGYSKDHRPDLKQFMTELLCVENGIPIFGKTLDGNSSDKTSNNKILTDISGIMARNGLGPGAFVYVADSAMITEKNLNSIGKNLFISRLPANYKECGGAIEKAIDRNDWKDIGVLAKTKATAKRPSAQYKVAESNVQIHGKSYRAVIVHSSAHDKRRQKRIERDLKKSAADLKKKLNKITVEFACEEDALSATAVIGKISSQLHFLKTSIQTIDVKKAGRPSKEGAKISHQKFQISWEIMINEEKVKRLTKVAGCFVLITNTPIADEKNDNALDAKSVLQMYKGQYGVESDFAFLKDPLIVNNLFLKTPSRIDVLGMVMIISLMIWRLMERNMRAHVANTGEKLPGLNKQKTDRPTAFMLSVLIRGVKIILTVSGERILLKPPKEKHILLLKALGLNKSVFTDRQCKCRPIIPEKLCD